MIPCSSSSSSDQPPPASEVDATKCTVTSTPVSLVVSNVALTGCSVTCLHEKRLIRRDLQKWSKNVAYLVGE